MQNAQAIMGQALFYTTTQDQVLSTLMPVDQEI